MQLPKDDEIISCAPWDTSLSIREVFANTTPGSEVSGFFRSGFLWAESAKEIQEAIQNRGLRVTVVVGEESAVMATEEDPAIEDLKGAVKKFCSIRIPRSSKGRFRLYRNKILLPLSYQRWRPEGNCPVGMLTCGANISTGRKQAIILGDGHPFKKSLDELSEHILRGSRLYFQTPGRATRLHPAEESSPRTQTRPSYPNRAAWLDRELEQRAWSVHALNKHGGPDATTTKKVLEGVSVRVGTLESIATALSTKGKKVTMEDIPKN